MTRVTDVGMCLVVLLGIRLLMNILLNACRLMKRRLCGLLTIVRICKRVDLVEFCLGSSNRLSTFRRFMRVCMG